MLLRLDEQEHELLIDLLGTALGNLREEIYKTDSAEYEAGLRQREVCLIAVLNRLTAAAPRTPLAGVLPV